MNYNDVFYKMFKTYDEKMFLGDGTAYFEIQYCKIFAKTRKKQLTTRKFKHWAKDSLYIYLDDCDDFLEQYYPLIEQTLDNESREFEFDYFGLNYYNNNQVELLIKLINEKKPKEFETLIHWLEGAKQFNGIYIFGI